MTLKESQPDLKLPTDESIKDRSKADAFSKAFACGQAGWLIIHCIARHAAGLPITELELVTIAISLCALIMYLVWWHKPFGVEYATIIPLEISALHRLHPPTDSMRQGGFSPLSTQRIDREMSWDLWDIFVFQAATIRARADMALLTRAQGAIVYTLGTIFSALHLAAWNWEFPSPTARTLWRVSGVVATAIPPCAILAILTSPAFSYYELKILFLVCLGLLYLLCRLTLISLVFYCFSSMPSAVYSGIGWVNALPHFA